MKMCINVSHFTFLNLILIHYQIFQQIYIIFPP
jgi:hypothetical protein